jgi:predicted permease
MSLRSRLATWWGAVIRSREVDAQVQDELQFHLERHTEDLMGRGWSREEATRQAHADLGSTAAVRENARQAWGVRWLDDLRDDVRLALRMLVKSPGFAVVAVGSLALGIGANTVIYTAAQHMLLDRLNVPNPEQLRMLEWSHPEGGIVQNLWGWYPGSRTDTGSTSFSYPVFQQLRLHNSQFESLFAFKPLSRQTVTVNGSSETVSAEMVSGNYYSSLGVRPALGRAIQESDDGAVGASPVVVISYRFWTNEFRRSPDAVGKTILVNLTPLTIIGVNPPGFTGAFSAQGTPDIFLPFAMQPIVAPMDTEGSRGSYSLLSNPNLWWVLIMGRKKSGVTDSAAAASLTPVLGAAVRGTMNVKDHATLPTMLLMDGSRGQNPAADGMTKPIYVLLGLAGFVLLLACANLANLLLARAGARQREMGVRLALGAGRARILRQMFTESLLLSLLGGAAGLALVWAMRNAVPRLLSASWNPPAFRASLSWPIFVFAAGISIATGLIFGLAPAMQATRVRVSPSLKDAGGTATRRRRGLAGKSIVIVQVALSMLLVVVAGLFVQTLSRLGHTSLGFRTDHLILFDLEPPQTRYRGAATIPLFHQLEQKLSALPGVEAATLVQVPLISGNVDFTTVIPPGTQRKPEDNPSAEVNDVGETFFSIFGVPIHAGRAFDASDTESSRKVAVVNESFAKAFFPRLNPVGRSFEAGSHEAYTLEIVGVCADTKYDSVRKSPEPEFYRPYRQNPNGVESATFVLRTQLKAETILPSVRQIIAGVDGGLPILNVRTQDEQIKAKLQHEIIFAKLSGGFGVLALVLASIGIYGIMAYSVSRRINEIGIRIALGAQRPQILSMVLQEASWVTGVGVLAGAAAALALGRVIEAMLYGLKPWDPATILGSATLLFVSALAAACIPARRAASVEPTRALHHD